MRGAGVVRAVAVGAAILAGSVGCATKGYVRGRIADLRAEIDAIDSRRQAQIDQGGRLALSARSAADSAHARLDLVRELALGSTGFREATRSRVYFAVGSSVLKAESKSVLDDVVAQALRNPRYVVNLYGFSDPSGSKEYNQALARRRVDAVERYLVARTPGQLSRYRSISFGEEVPATEAAALARAADRRQVPVILLEPAAPGAREDALTERQPGR